MKRIVYLAAVAMIMVSCTAVETTDPVPVTVAQFDPAPVAPDVEHLALPAVPTPSNMLLNPATGQVELPLTVAVPVLGQQEPELVNAFSTETAEELALTYINTLYGYTRDTALDASFSGRPINPDTVSAETIKVVDVTPINRRGGDQQAVAGLTFTLGERSEAGVTPLKISLPPGQLYLQGHTYAAVLTTGIEDVDGESIKSSYIFNLLKSTAPLTAADGRSVCALPDALAQQLEALRSQMYEPLFDALSGQLTRGDIALAWVFTIRPGAIALNDPLASIFPTPNALVMTSAAGSKHDCDGDGKADCQSGHLCFPVDCDNDSPVQKAFFQYLNGLDGWPASMPITAGFSLPLEEVSVSPQSVGLYRLGGETPLAVPVAVELDDAGTTLSLKPSGVLEAGGHYAAYLKTDLMTQGGVYEVRPSTVTAVTRLVSPVFTGGKSNLTDFGVSDNQSVLLEVMRLGTDKLIKALGLDQTRQRLASLWEFTIHSHNEALYDPTGGLLPYPNDVLMTLDSKGNPERVNVPLDPEWSLAQYGAVLALNELDGFSTIAGASTRFLQPLDPASFRFVNAMTDLVGGGLGETFSLAVADVTDVDPAGGIEGLAPLLDAENILGDGEMTARFEFGSLVLKPAPGKPLKAGHRYMVVAFDNLASKAVDAEGVAFPVEVAPVFFLARSPDPLVDESGNSQLATLGNDEAGLLESLRLQYNAIFSALESELVGIPRERVVMFWTFTTQSIGNWMHKLKKKLVTLSIGPGSAPGTVEDGAGSGLEFASKVVFDGSFAGFTALLQDEGSSFMNFDAEGTPDWQAMNLPLLILVPEAHDDILPPFPVAIIQHGLYGNKEEVLAQADTFLEAGYAVIAMDLPFHGDRVLAGGADGEGFYSFDPIATRDHILESAFNIIQLISYVGRGNSGFKLWLTQATGEPGLLDTDKLFFVGNSLGAMAGTLALAVTDEVSAAALVVPAGNLTRILIETPDKAFQEPVNAALEALGLVPGTAAYQQFVDTAQALLDRADPVNYARHITGERFLDAPPIPLFFLTAGKDGLMPKGASKELICAARGNGYPYWKEYKDMCHAFFFHGCGEGDALDPAGAQAAEDILTFFAQLGDASAIEGVVDANQLDCQDL